MDYDIIGADKTIGQIQVSYKNEEGNVVATYAIDIPVVEGKYITGDALHAEIILRAPTWILSREKDVEKADNFDQIEALVKKTKPTVLTVEQMQNMAMWQKTEFEMKVADVLVKYGLIGKNPTVIEVTKL